MKNISELGLLCNRTIHYVYIEWRL